MTPAYLQDSRPDFAPFEIDCGTIPAFRFQGNLQSELAAGRIDGATAVGLLEDMLMIRELEEMIVTVRSGAYEPLAGFNYRGPTHVSIGQEGASVGACSALILKDHITSTHRGHGDSVARGCCALRDMTDELLRKRVPHSTAVGREELLEAGLGRARLSHHRGAVRQRGWLLPGARRQHAHRGLYGGPPGRERHCGRRRAHRHRRGDGFALPAKRRRGVLLCRGWRLLQRRGSGIAELGGPGAIHQ